MIRHLVILGVAAATLAAPAFADTPPATWKANGPNVTACYDHLGVLVDCGGSGGGGAATIANGADTAEGNTGDSPYTTGPGTVVGVDKGIYTALTLTVAPVVSPSAEACHVLKNVAGSLLRVGGYGGQAEFVEIFNATSAPSDGAVTPVDWGYLPTAGAWSMNYPTPLSLSVGITVCYSTAGPFSKTAISTNNAFSGQVQ